MSIKFSRTRSQESGFTLVVIAALFVAFAVIAAVAVERNTNLQMVTRRDAARDQLTRLSNAIIEYAVFNKSGTNLMYPCPARLDQLTSSSSFGASVGPPATAPLCSDITGDVAANPSTTSTGIPILGAAGAPVLRGMVPVQTLSQYGISMNEAFDPWDNRIVYVVNRNLTLGSVSLNVGNPALSDPRTGAAFPAPDFILISYGRDGVGATKRNSTSIAIPCTNGGTTLRFENCDVDTDFYLTPSYTAADATTTTYFDDVISFYRQ